MARPPLQAARQAATKRLIETHRDDWNAMVDQELAKRGWAQEVVERRVWTKSPNQGNALSVGGDRYTST